MLMKVCPHCKGDGFWRRQAKDTSPFQNMAHATMIYADGSRWPAMALNGEMPRGSPVTYEFPCFKCSSTGEIQWARGKSVTPIVR